MASCSFQVLTEVLCLSQEVQTLGRQELRDSELWLWRTTSYRTGRSSCHRRGPSAADWPVDTVLTSVVDSSTTCGMLSHSHAYTAHIKYHLRYVTPFTCLHSTHQVPLAVCYAIHMPTQHTSSTTCGMLSHSHAYTAHINHSTHFTDSSHWWGHRGVRKTFSLPTRHSQFHVPVPVSGWDNEDTDHKLCHQELT